MFGSERKWNGVAAKWVSMSDNKLEDNVLLKEHCRNEFARIASLLKVPHTRAEAEALVSELARIRAMFIAVEGANCDSV